MNRPLRLMDCSPRVSWADVALLTIRSQHFGRPSAAVGADLSCPHIHKHPRNGERKHIFNNVKMRIC
ncbi:hypothetical protein [Prevotella pallens]|uniref:hypothetical protein n=1 Tax=Prevotella pallens TaxID=60133 RepID=UPI003C7D1E3B